MPKTAQEVACGDIGTLLVEARRREQAKGRLDSIREGLLPGIQSDLYDDESRQIAMLHVRSGGKTWALLSRAVKCALNGGDVAFISKTYRSVENIAWETLLKLCRTHDIPIHPNNAKLVARLGGRGRICFFGADNKKFKDNLRGSRWSLIIVDEAGHFYTDLDTLVRQVLIPCTYARKGTIILTGTPSYVPQGLFYDLTRSDSERKGWSVHECHDPFYNPYAKDDVAESISAIKEEFGDEWESLPFVRRELFAEWTHDNSKLVYQFNPSKNVFKRYNFNKGDRHILGLDFSFTGRTGLVETISNPDKYRALFVMRSTSLEDIGLDQIDRLGPYLVEYHERTGGDIVFDHSQGFIKDALSEAFPELSFIPAQKTDKYTHIELFNADLKSSRILIKLNKNDDLLDEWSRGTWKRNPDGSVPAGKPKQNGKDKWDCSDALLYAWRESRVRQYGGQGDRPPKPGTKEYFEEVSRRLMEQARSNVGKTSYFL